MITFSYIFTHLGNVFYVLLECTIPYFHIRYYVLDYKIIRDVISIFKKATLLYIVFEFKLYMQN